MTTLVGIFVKGEKGTSMLQCKFDFVYETNIVTRCWMVEHEVKTKGIFCSLHQIVTSLTKTKVSQKTTFLVVRSLFLKGGWGFRGDHLVTMALCHYWPREGRGEGNYGQCH